MATKADADGVPAVRRRGSIAVSLRTIPNGGCTGVLPPFSGGLHCGYGPFFFWLPQVTGAPAVQRRAPLRPAARNQSACTPHACIRPGCAAPLQAVPGGGRERSCPSCARPARRHAAVARRRGFLGRR